MVSSYHPSENVFFIAMLIGSNITIVLNVWVNVQINLIKCMGILFLPCVSVDVLLISMEIQIITSVLLLSAVLPTILQIILLIYVWVDVHLLKVPLEKELLSSVYKYVLKDSMQIAPQDYAVLHAQQDYLKILHQNNV